MEIIHGLFHGMDDVLFEVAAAIGPLVAILVICQLLFLRMSAREFSRLLTGFGLGAVGLLLFLQGVHVAFLPVGEELGRTLTTSSSPWWLVPIGFVLGFMATVAEPAVRLLNDEVYETSAGAIPTSLLLWTLAFGVGLSVALAIVRTIVGIPLWTILVPGYTIALLTIRYARADFVAIAFDAGGAATGPMTVTFIVALGLGAASAFPGRDPLLHGFGLVSLVALAPILCVLAVGVFYARKGRASSGESQESTEPGV